MTREKDSETERRRGRRRGPRAQKLFSSSFDSLRKDTRSDWLARARIRLETRSGHQSLVKPRRLVVEMPTQCPFVDRSAVSLSLVRWPLLHRPVSHRVSLFLLEFRSDQLLALFLFSGYPTAFLCPLDSFEVFSLFFFIRWVRKNFRGERLSRAFFHSKLSIAKPGIRESPNSEFTKLGTFGLWHCPTSAPSNHWSFESLHLKISFSIIESLDITIFQAFHVYSYNSSSIPSSDLPISGSLNLSIFESLDIRTYKFPDNFYSQKFHAERLQSSCSFLPPSRSRYLRE